MHAIPCGNGKTLAKATTTRLKTPQLNSEMVRRAMHSTEHRATAVFMIIFHQPGTCFRSNRIMFKDYYYLFLW